ncbi:MAG: class B sortase [Lachnospiraceae bacterium]|nr:class B sortase [Lachnospiraceae bacterium]
MRRRGGGLSTGMLVLLVVIAALLCIIMGVLMYMDNHGMIGGGAGTTEESGQEQEPDTEAVQETDADTSEQVADEVKIPFPDNKDADIEGLIRDENPDIYAWLYVPETGIDAPVLQHPEDVFYYTTHNAKGEKDPNGAVFTQFFNTKSFDDNVTVIYGSNNTSEGPFYNLSLFSDPEFFNTHPYIYIYTDNEVLAYETFAAYESDDKLIVMFYGTDVDDQFYVYLDLIKENIGMNGNLKEDIYPTVSDTVLTLSTRVKGKDDRRYLVQAKLIGRKPR